MYKTSLRSVTAEIEELLSQKLSARGRDLKEKIKHAGRRLPKSVRLEAQYLIDAEARHRNPKRAGQYDPARVLSARKHCVDYLEKIDASQRRGNRRLAWFTGVLVNSFVIGILVALAVHWLR